jgi:hypothetical protein
MQAEEIQVKRESITYNTERERAEAEQGRIDSQLEREIVIAKMNQDGVLTQEEIASKERLQAIKISNDNALFNAEAALKVSQGSGI